MRQLTAQIDTRLHDILDKLSPDREDTNNARGHRITVMEDSLMLGRRITKLEEEIRRQRRDSQR